MMCQLGWPIPRALQRALEFVQQPPTGRPFTLTQTLGAAMRPSSW